MSLPDVKVSAYYTEQAATVDASASVDEARKLMERHGVRHLPLVHEGKTAGVVSMRDIHAALAVKGANPKHLSVSDISTDHAYTTHRDASLAVVAGEMAEKKYGSAVVTDEAGTVIGIFTTTDAMRALAQVLSGQLKDD